MSTAGRFAKGLFAAFIKAEAAKWSKVVKDSGATLD